MPLPHYRRRLSWWIARHGGGVIDGWQLGSMVEPGVIGCGCTKDTNALNRMADYEQYTQCACILGAVFGYLRVFRPSAKKKAKPPLLKRPCQSSPGSKKEND